MKRVYYNKLIRDKVLEQLDEKEIKYSARRIEGGELSHELAKKLLEESVEVAEALEKKRDEELFGEMADLQEVLDTLLESLGLSKEELEVYMERKNEKRGAFKNGDYIEWTEDGK